MLTTIFGLLKVFMGAVEKFLDRLHDQMMKQAGRDEVGRQGAEDALKRAQEANAVRDSDPSDDELLNKLRPPQERKTTNTNPS